MNRLDKSFQAFFRRCKTGEKPGFPRFRGFHRYSSLCYPQSGFSLVGHELKLSKIGTLRMKKMHRPIEGEIKTCTVRKNPSGDWTVSFSCEVNVQAKPLKQESVGIDVGLKEFATLSNGETISHPRFFKKGEKNLGKAERKLEKLEKGTPERGKQRKVIAKIHEKIGNQRRDFCHKASRKIINQHQYIFVEDLDIKKMMEDSPLAKSITDASWNQFLQFLTYKAEEAGRIIGWVNPAYTTQDCYECGHRERKSLAQRTHACTNCGYNICRDLNAAQNILALGLDGLGLVPRSPRL